MKIKLVGKKSVWVPDIGVTFVRNEPKVIDDKVAQSLLAQGIFEIVKDTKKKEEK